MRRVALAIVVAFAMAGGCAGCGIPEDDQAREIRPEVLPAEVTAPQNSTTTSIARSGNNVTETYYLTRPGDAQTQDRLEGVVGPYPNDRDTIVGEVLTALFNANEPPLRNNIPSAWQILGISYGSDGALELNMNEAFRTALEGQGLRQAIAQIVFTVMNLDHTPRQVTGVRFLVEGQPVAAATDSGAVQWPDAVTMRDFEKFCRTFPGCTPEPGPDSPG